MSLRVGRIFQFSPVALLPTTVFDECESAPQIRTVLDLDKQGIVVPDSRNKGQDRIVEKIPMSSTCKAELRQELQIPSS
jgi:hypothetical protein